MDAFLTGLTKRQAMLLLTAVTFGGQEGVQSFAYLPNEEGEILSDRARQILAIPREKRVPFLVQEIKRFVTGRKAEDLRSADPKLVAEALHKERPAMVELVLRSLPSQLAADLRIELAQPVLEIGREVKPEVLAVIRWQFEKQLAGSMPKQRGFAIVDLLVLAAGDLICLADVLGAREVCAPAASLPEPEREAWLQQLPPDQRLLVQRALATRQPTRRAEAEVARRALAEAADGGEPRDAVRLAGLRRIARACLTQSPEFAARLIEKHRGELGRQLARCVSTERQGARRPDENAKREVLEELDLLADKGLIERPVRLPPPPMPRRPAPSVRPSAPADVAPPAADIPRVSSAGLPRVSSPGIPRARPPEAPGPGPRVSGVSPRVAPLGPRPAPRPEPGARPATPASHAAEAAPRASPLAQRAPTDPPRPPSSSPRNSALPARAPVSPPRVSVSTPRVSISNAPRVSVSSAPRVSVPTPRVSVSMPRAPVPAPRIERGGAAAEEPSEPASRRPAPPRGPRKP